MPMPADPLELLALARADDRRALARCISIVEDDRAGAPELLARTYRQAGRAHVVGITGSPGAGKSTLTDRLVSHARQTHELVAVVAVDPSSPFTGGAILGDRIRMQEHVSDRGVFVRSMSTRGRLGGLSDGTAKVVTVLDGVGFDPVFVETVGVGQSEVEVMDLADTVVVVLTPGMGDGIQAAKAGLLEIGHVFVVNKADRPGADDVVRDLRQMIELGSTGDWEPPIVTCVATAGEGLSDVTAAIASHRDHLGAEGRLEKRRAEQAAVPLRRALFERMRQRAEPGLEDVLPRVVDRTIDPWSAVDHLVVGG
ncbi:MAG: methylmalonyl Co-A mutase-associated GTPase MeaB [Acidimicrobiia bacterium]